MGVAGEDVARRALGRGVPVGDNRPDRRRDQRAIVAAARIRFVHERGIDIDVQRDLRLGEGRVAVHDQRADEDREQPERRHDGGEAIDPQPRFRGATTAAVTIRSGRRPIDG